MKIVPKYIGRKRMKFHFFVLYLTIMEGNCKVCGKHYGSISQELGVCLDCIRHRFKEAKKHIDEAHRGCRKEMHLATEPPKDKDGIPCDICINQCRIGKGRTGFCGVRKNENGRIKDFGGATLTYYREKLPVNCVADFVCAGCTEAGYPQYSQKKGPEKGYNNLTVFYGACSFDCLFCHNWHFRDFLVQPHVVTAEELASQVDEKTTCVCFFGGDPTPQLHHALEAAKLMLDRNKARVLRICFETNGSMNASLAERIADIALNSGGTVKVDIKAFNDELHYALTGVSNEWTLRNFKLIAEMAKKRKQPPLLVASTLLIPGYMDVGEVGRIAKFIAEIDPHIPYCLLAFYPQFYMYDLLPTTKKLAHECLKAAKEAGLKNVSIGNKHLLVN